MAYPVVGSGLDSQLSAVAESTYGVAPSFSAARSYEFKTETLELKKTTVQGQGLAAGHLYDRTKRRVLTNYDVSGAITMDCPTRQLAFWLQNMVGSFGQSLATPVQISSTGVYYSVHQGIGGQQTTGGLLSNSFAIQKGVPDISGDIYPFTYVGCKLSDWEIKVSVGAIAEMTLTVDGRNELAGAYPNGGIGSSNDPLNASTPALATWGVPTSGIGEQLFHFKEATVYTGGTPSWGAAPYGSGNIVSLSGESTASNVKDCDIKHSVKFDNSRIFLGSSGFKAAQIENGFRSITGSMTVEWQSGEALYNAFAADTTTSLELKFTGPAGAGGSNYLLDIIIPNIKLDGESPKIPGPGVITQAVSFTGLDDETTVPIQFTYQSEDTAI
jgi:hypothetical protein